MALRLQERDERLVEAGICCSKCQERFEFSQSDMMTFETDLGTLRIWRSYLACRQCKVYFFPLDAALEAPARGEIAPRFGKSLSLLGVEMPFARGTRLLEVLTGRHLAPSTLASHLQRDGQCLVELEKQQAEAYWPFDDKGLPRRVDAAVVRQQERFQLARPRPVGRAVVLETDGAMVNLGQEPEVQAEMRAEELKAKKQARQARAEGSKSPPDQKPHSTPYRESMQIAIYRLDDVVRKPRPKPRRPGVPPGRARGVVTHKQYACVVNNPEMFPKQINRLSCLWNVEAYTERLLLGDGASKIWEAGREYLRPTVEILDINHGRGHVRDCGGVLYADNPKKAKSWTKTWCRHLLKKGPDSLLRHLRQLQAEQWSGHQRRILDNLVEYVETHHDRMNYPEFIKKGYPIASGLIEGANSHLLGHRCKIAAQVWKRANLQGLLALRCAAYDDRWEIVMKAVRQHQAYPKLAQPLISEERAPRPQLPPPPKPVPKPSLLDRFLPWRKRAKLSVAAASPGSALEAGSPGSP